MSTTANVPTLYTISWSHFNDSVRFVLNMCDEDYEEYAFLPLFNMPAVNSLSKKGKTETPLIKLADGEIIQDSKEIIEKFAEKHDWLIPEQHKEEIDEFMTLVWKDLGTTSRRVAYQNLLPESLSTIKYALKNKVSLPQKIWFIPVYPLFKFILDKALLLNDDVVVKGSYERMDNCFDKAEELLEANGGDFLFGDEMTAADIYFACISGPIIFQPNYGLGVGPITPIEECSQKWQDVVKKYRERPAGQFALKMYSEHGEKLKAKAVSKVKYGSTMDQLKQMVIFPLVVMLVFVMVLKRVIMTPFSAKPKEE